MDADIYDFIKEATATTGNGLTLTLTAETGFGRFSDVASVSDVVYYAIQNGANRELGIGTVQTGNTLDRTTPLVTLVGSTYDNTTPTRITLAGSSVVVLAASAKAVLDAATAGIFGDPGTEGSGITIGGVTYEAAAKVSDIGGTNEAQFILHRHSTTLPPVIVGARTQGNVAGHTIVNDGDSTIALFGSGWDGTNYELSGSLSLEVDGTPGANDMPGRWVFKTTPDGSATPVEALRISQDKSVTFSGAFTFPIIDGDAGEILIADGLGSVTWSSYLDIAQTWTKGQRGEITVLTDAATITPDMADSNFYSVTLAGNRTLANPTNLVVGQSGSIFITQDATGTRTLAYGSQWDFVGAIAPTLSTAASTVDRLDYVVRTTGSIHAVLTRAWA